MAARIPTLLAALVLSLSAGAPTLAAEWRRYVDPDLAFSIELPTSGYDLRPGETSGIILTSPDGEAQIKVQGIANERHLSAVDVMRLVEQADPKRLITYRASGKTWFVLSGYLDGGRTRIFYAKFLMNREGSLSSFELNYPAGRKRAFDPIVARLENTLTAPPG